MLTAGMLTLSGGRIANSGNVPAAGAGGCPIDATGALAIVTTVPAVFVNGAGYDSSGRLCTSTNAITGYGAGFAFDAQGRAVTDAVGAIAGYVAGVPVTATGALALA